MRTILTLAGASLMMEATAIADTNITIELPRIHVAEYHRPYVAVWLAQPNHKVIANLAVWYQQHDGEEGEGKSWLKDVRQWWRRSGRKLDLPIDGISGPTQAPGIHEVSIPQGNDPFKNLPAGDYILNVEAAREVGGRELLRIPFTWPADGPITQTISGSTELGDVTLTVDATN